MGAIRSNILLIQVNDTESHAYVFVTFHKRGNEFTAGVIYATEINSENEEWIKNNRQQIYDMAHSEMESLGLTIQK